MSISFCLPHPVVVNDFIICSGVCACTEMMCVLYVSLGLRLILYIAGSGVNRVQVVLSGFSVILFYLSRQKLYVCMVVCISWMHSCLFV